MCLLDENKVQISHAGSKDAPHVELLTKLKLLFRFHDSEGNRVYPIREVFEELIQEGRHLSSPILSANMASS